MIHIKKRTSSCSALINYVNSVHTEVYIPMGVIKTSVHIINFVANHSFENNDVVIGTSYLSQFYNVSERYVTAAIKLLKDSKALSFYRTIEGRTAKENAYSFPDSFASLEDEGTDISLPADFLESYKSLKVLQAEVCGSLSNTDNINKKIILNFSKKEDKCSRLNTYSKNSNEVSSIIEYPKYDNELFEQLFLRIWNAHITSRPLWYVAPVTLKRVIGVFQSKFLGKWDLLNQYLDRVGRGNLNVSKFASYADGNYTCKSWQLNIGYIMKPEVIEKVESGAWDLDHICAERTARKVKKEKVDDDDTLPPQEKEVRKKLISTVGITFYKSWLEKAKVIFTEAKEVILKLPSKFMLDYAQRPSAEYNRIKGCGFQLTC